MPTTTRPMPPQPPSHRRSARGSAGPPPGGSRKPSTVSMTNSTRRRRRRSSSGTSRIVASPSESRQRGHAILVALAMGRFVGSHVKRLEDPRLLQGQGSYLDDLALPGLGHLVFVRSPHAHAEILTVDAAAARAVPGVLAVLVAADLAGLAP